MALPTGSPMEVYGSSEHRYECPIFTQFVISRSHLSNVYAQHVQWLRKVRVLLIAVPLLTATLLWT